MIRWTFVAVSFVLVTVALAGLANGIDYPVAGTQLTLRRQGNKGALMLVLRDSSIPVPAPDSTEDPSRAGLTLAIFARGSGERPMLFARAGRDLWKIRTTPKVVVYSYIDPTATFLSQDLSTAKLRTGSGLRLRAKSPGLTFEAPEGAVAVRVEWGSVRVCALFDGDSVRRDKAGLFIARNADASGLTDCDDETLSGASCPCWTAENLDEAFPPGFFDDADRGGAVCSVSGIPATLSAADTCTLFGPGGDDFELPRGGVAVLPNGSCVLLDDADPNNSGVCNHPPTVLSVTPAQSAACVATLHVSQAYQRECP